jgi:hypothetical protein
MAALITCSNSDGVYGRCDAKCYNATHSKCDCICGGANHGVGETQAVQNTNELAETWIEAYKKDHADKELIFKISEKIKQLSLF